MVTQYLQATHDNTVPAGYTYGHRIPAGYMKDYAVPVSYTYDHIVPAGYMKNYRVSIYTHACGYSRPPDL